MLCHEALINIDNYSLTNTTHSSLSIDYQTFGCKSSKSQSTCFVAVAFNVYKSAMYRFCAEIPGPRAAGVTQITTYLSTVLQ